MNPLTLFEAVRGATYLFERRGETGVHRHLQNNFQDRIGSAANVQGPSDMIPQLRLRIAKDGQDGNGQHFLGVQIETRACTDVGERKLNQTSRQSRTSGFEGFQCAER